MPYPRVSVVTRGAEVAFATSIDALAAGLTLPLLETPIVISIAVMLERAYVFWVRRDDVEALRDLPYQDQIRACVDAVLRSELAKDRGFADLRQRVEQVWLEAAEKAIAKNETSFAILPMSQVMRDDGILARLAAKGYEIVPPKPRVEADAEEAAAVESER